MSRRLLVVEDHPGLRRQLKLAFGDLEVIGAATREQALVALRRYRPAVVLQDLALPPDADGATEGFATMEATLGIAPETKIIVVTGHKAREHALRAVSLGAYDVCEKPVDTQTIATIIDRAMRICELEREIRRRNESRIAFGLPGVIAGSASMLKVCRVIRRLAPQQVTVLLLGETGTGKERLARALHDLSPRAGKPMVAINCAAIPEALLESELFGYERGAFSGAVKQTIGRIETARGGTLFLDEIGDLPLPLQAKLLRFLQERVIERIGGRKTIPVAVRIVAATHRRLEAAIQQGFFRKDLYYRINEVAVEIPPLRARESDCVLIAEHVLQQARSRHGRTALRFAPEAIGAIEQYSWPGNVRELENRINHAVVVADGALITSADLGLAPAHDDPSDLVELHAVRQSAEARAVRRALALAAGNITKAAELLGVARPTLYHLMARISIRPADD